MEKNKTAKSEVKKRKIIYGLLCCFCFALAFQFPRTANVLLFDAMPEGLTKSILLVLGYTILIAMYGSAVFCFYRFIDSFVSSDFETAFDKKEFVESINKSLEDRSKDVVNLMADNMGEIKEYFTISKSHARKSFGFAVGAAIFGLLLFTGSVTLGIQAGNIDAAIIGVIGGGITEIVSIFALHIFKNSQEQLNHYYKALHENEQYLSTVHLVSKLSDEKQDDTYIEIIRNSLERHEQTQRPDRSDDKK